MIFQKCNPCFINETYDQIIFSIIFHKRYDILDSTIHYFGFNIINKNGETPLIHICKYVKDFDHKYFVKILDRSNIGTEDNLGNTALHYLNEKDDYGLIGFFNSKKK